ncbi:FadR/GntR family transcriptional regulator [Streptomyces sp. TRM68367]|uniref:FadR/GntR family transcriptional regulator n=1 Tax=Streptomyces sp. TRM68367 TaxID=2758415 RepID=UPI00165B4B71|nr:GntR family transcriptional regulator [Streptomyces sp. TRM68367]MBC9727576.1 FadR family transcriptional regulator [Streptomyces sp. TRM68367]
MSLSDKLAERLLYSIIDGHYPPGTALPPEGALAEEYAASRLTVREAIKVLRSQNVVRIHRGRGTYVNAPDHWTALEPMIRAAATAPRAGGAISEKLIEARRLIEVGAAQLAAARCTIPLLSEPFGRLLIEGRRETSAVPQIRTNAIAHHEAVLEALRTGEPDKARRAMDDHMAQTADDLRTHVISKRT